MRKIILLIGLLMAVAGCSHPTPLTGHELTGYTVKIVNPYKITNICGAAGALQALESEGAKPVTKGPADLTVEQVPIGNREAAVVIRKKNGAVVYSSGGLSIVTCRDDGQSYGEDFVRSISSHLKEDHTFLH